MSRLLLKLELTSLAINSITYYTEQIQSQILIYSDVTYVRRKTHEKHWTIIHVTVYYNIKCLRFRLQSATLPAIAHRPKTLPYYAINFLFANLYTLFDLLNNCWVPKRLVFSNFIVKYSANIFETILLRFGAALAIWSRLTIRGNMIKANKHNIIKSHLLAKTILAHMIRSSTVCVIRFTAKQCLYN